VEARGICSVHALPLERTRWWGYAHGHHKVGWEFDTEEECIHAAFLYTQEHQEKIARSRKAVWLIEGCLLHRIAKHYEDDADTFRDILAREQATLDDLFRGWRE